MLARELANENDLFALSPYEKKILIFFFLAAFLIFPSIDILSTIALQITLYNVGKSNLKLYLL